MCNCVLVHICLKKHMCILSLGLHNINKALLERLKQTITVFLRDLQVAATLHSISATRTKCEFLCVFFLKNCIKSNNPVCYRFIAQALSQ